MSNYDTVLASHTHLRGHTITETGWEKLEHYTAGPEPYVVINDFFTNYTEDQIARCIRDELTEPLFETADFLATLSAPDGKRSFRNQDMTIDAKSMDVHADPELGNVYLANFLVEGNPFYTVYPNVTRKFFKYQDAIGETFFTTANPSRSQKIQIMSKQLVILTGDAAETKYGKNEPATITTIPHEVTVSEGDSRILFLAHGVAQIEDLSAENSKLESVAA